MKRTILQTIRVSAIALASLSAVSLAGPAIAQDAPDQQENTPSNKPPLPQPPDAPPMWMYVVVGGALAGATIFLSIMPSKRGHQD